MELLLETTEVEIILDLLRGQHPEIASTVERQLKDHLLIEQAANEMMESDYNDREKFLDWHVRLIKEVSPINPILLRWRYIGEKKGHLEPLNIIRIELKKEEQQ